MNDAVDKVKASQLVDFETLLNTATLTVTRTTLRQGGEVPWHRHAEVRDCFNVSEGVIDILTDNGAPPLRLAQGEQGFVTPGVGHRVVNAGTSDATFVLVQTGGKHDFLALDSVNSQRGNQS